MRILTALLFTILLPLSLSAHTRATFPTPRYDLDFIKNSNDGGPCGDILATNRGVAPSGVISEFIPGDTITVMALETIGHVGVYAVYFAESNDAINPAGCGANKPGNCLEQNLIDDVADPAGNQGTHEIEVTLPDVECENCTIQVIQWMSDGNGSYTPYYTCSDISLKADAIPPDPSPTPTPTPGGGTANQNGDGEDVSDAERAMFPE